MLPVITEPKFATEANKFVNIPVTPFIRFATIDENVEVAEETVSGPEIVVVPLNLILESSSICVDVATPFTIEVMVLPVLVENEIALVVLALIDDNDFHSGVPDAFIERTIPEAPAVSSAALLLAFPISRAPLERGMFGSCEKEFTPEKFIPLNAEFEIERFVPPSTGEEITAKPPPPPSPGAPCGPVSPLGPCGPATYRATVLTISLTGRV